MRKFMRRVRRVCPGIDASSGDDAEEENRIPDGVEGVDADAVAFLQAQGFEACCELADGFVCEAGGDEGGGGEGVDVDLEEC